MTKAQQTSLTELVTRTARQLIAEGQGWSDRKVWISDVLEALNVRASQQFKGWLIELNTAGTLELARCDLNTAANAAKLAASETLHPMGYGEFHLVTVAV